MGRLSAGMAAALLACSAAAGAEVVVRVAGDRVDLRATSAPLAEVLDQLGRQTGMRVVYEGPPPRQPVTVAFEGRSHAEAVLALLEGQGLNFAIVSDATGARVETLILAGTAGTGTSAGRASAAPPRPVRRPFRPPPGASPDTQDSTFDEPAFDDPVFDELAEEPVEDPSLPGESPEEATPDPGAAAGQPVPGAPATGAGATPFIGGQPASSAASPFTPQPFSVLPFPPAPPGTPGAAEPEEGAPAEAEPPLN